MRPLSTLCAAAAALLLQDLCKLLFTDQLLLNQHITQAQLLPRCRRGGDGGNGGGGDGRSVGRKAGGHGATSTAKSVHGSPGS